MLWSRRMEREKRKNRKKNATAASVYIFISVYRQGCVRTFCASSSSTATSYVRLGQLCSKNKYSLVLIDCNENSNGYVPLHHNAILRVQGEHPPNGYVPLHPNAILRVQGEHPPLQKKPQGPTSTTAVLV